MSLPVLIIGGGGHAKVLINTLQLCSISILGIIDNDTNMIGDNLVGIPILGDDNVVFTHRPESILLVNAIGSIKILYKRRSIFSKFKEKGYIFCTVVHPSAIVASDTVLGEGTQIMAGAIIQPGSKLGMNTIVNTKTSIDHDCIIGNHVHLSPGVTLSGSVNIGDNTHLGTGTVVIQGLTIGANCLTGAGSVVIRHMPDDEKYLGVPTRKMRDSI